MSIPSSPSERAAQPSREAIPPAGAAEAPSRLSAVRFLQPLLPGLLVALVLGLVAGWVAGGLGDPLARNPVLVAMLLGLLMGNTLGCPESLKPGLVFVRRYLLRFAIVLVGFRVTATLMVDLGWAPILIATSELVLVLVVLYWAAVRLLRMDRDLALLVAIGSAVCGAAAILAAASTARLRADKAALAVTMITLAGTVALLTYPVAFLGGMLPGLDDDAYGIFVGASIYELAQVYGASYAVSELALNTATLVKLVKVLLLFPLLFLLAWWWRRRGHAETDTSKVAFPWFVLGFVAVMLFNTVVTLPPQRGYRACERRPGDVLIHRPRAGR